MVEHLNIPLGGEAVVQFKNAPFHSHVIHWVELSDHRWRDVSCFVQDCSLCLDGERAIQRFTAVVEHDGQEKILELPLSGWKVVAARFKKEGIEKFYATQWRIGKAGRAIDTDWFLEKEK